MNMACDLGYKAIIVETDYAEVVNLVEDPRYREGQFVDLASKIVKTNENLLFIFIVHVVRQVKYYDTFCQK